MSDRFSSRVNLFVQARNALLLLAVVLTGLFATSTVTVADEIGRPNVLFIAVDDLNTWAMELSDYAGAVTPNMNRLSQRGVVFSNAHCAAPACNPSRASVMTGVAPSNSGVYLNSQDWRVCSRLKDSTTLPALFREHGYKVMGGGKLYHAANLSVEGLTGFLDAEPWHQYFPSKTRQLADEFVPAKQSVNGSNRFYGGRFDWNPLEIEDAEMGDGKVVHWARQQLSRQHDQPLFLGVGIYRPHIPWYTPKKWFDQHPLNAIQLPETLQGDIDDIPAAGQAMSKHAWHQWLVDNEKWPSAVQAYLASVSFADAMVGELLDALDNGPLADNAIVVLWSDHGYHLGHKQHWEKRVLWEQATRVPLLIADRRFDTAGRRCERPVSLLDVYPTLADLCELKQPSQLDGESLRPFLDDPLTPSQRAVVSTQKRGNHAVRSQHWRYIRYADGSEELYDHRTDDHEFHNLAGQPEYADTILQLAAQLPMTDAPMDPAQTPNGSTITKTQRLVVSLAGDQRLDVFTVDGQGRLKPETQNPMDGKPGTSRFDQTGRHLYVGTAEPNTISVFKVQPDGLKQVQSVTVDAKPSYIAIVPSGRFLVASYYKTGQVTVHRIVGEGRLSNQPVQKLTIDERAHGVALDRSGQFAFVPHTAPNLITQFCFDQTTGLLSPNSPAKLLRREKAGPRHLMFHPHADFAYGSDEQGLSVTAYEFDPDNGTLSELQTVPSVPETYQEKGSTSHIEVHPTGEFVYVANRGHGTLAAFRVDTETGRLSLLQHAKTEPVTRSFCLTPDGEFLIAAGQSSGQLVCFRIAKDGRLSRANDIAAGETPFWVSPFPAAVRVQTPQATTADAAAQDRSLQLGQGTMAGEVTDTSVLLQTRLTLGKALDEKGDLPGATGVACFQWSQDEQLRDAVRTPFQRASAQHDFIVRSPLTKLQPNSQYFYRAIYGRAESDTQMGPICSFRTLPGANGTRPVKFIVGSCMNYIKFMHGREGNAGGPLTATAEDKREGFPAFVAMKELRPDFFVGTGDIVYYDNPFRVATTVEELRRCWHEQFRFPRMIEFFQSVPAYWSKDDHDFRYNDSDNASTRLPLPQTGIGMFHEQLPIAPLGAEHSPTYRTIRVSRDLQIWLTEGRDYRSPNNAPDGPDKTMWGKEQREWLKSTLKASDARWKILISPTPMVGPDDGYKNDNHATLAGFRHEADEFFEWVKQNRIDDLFLVCGDRHWQYHSIHPAGIHEFACGALNDENARMGVAPGVEYGTDPDGLVIQPFTSPEPSGGFVQFVVGQTLDVTVCNDQAKTLYSVQFPIDNASKTRSRQSVISPE